MPRDHFEIRRFDCAAASIGIEQRIRVAIACELLLEVEEQNGLTCELERDRLVFGKRSRDELVQSDCMEQARRDAPRETRPRTRQHRKTRPERVAGGRVRVPGLRVEKKVGETMAREMIGMRD